MADVLLNSSAISSDFDQIPFEITFKKRLNWTRKNWQDAGMSNSRLHKFTLFCKYWNSKLKDTYHNNVSIMTFFNDKKDYSYDIETILDEIEKIIPLNNIVGIFKLRNSRLLGFEYKDVNSKKAVEDRLRMLEGNNVVYLTWALNDGLIDLTMHWVPTTIENDNILPYFGKYIKILNIERETNSWSNRLTVKTGKIFVQGKLNDRVQAEDIPHFVFIGSAQVLVTIRGRSPLCLSCEVVGHIAAVCPTPYCKICKKKLPKLHNCVPYSEQKDSYSQRLKDVNSEYNFSEDQANSGINYHTDEQSNVATEQSSLNRKIKTKNVVKEKNPQVNSATISVIKTEDSQHQGKAVSISDTLHAPYLMNEEKFLSGFDFKDNSTSKEDNSWGAEVSSEAESVNQDSDKDFIPSKKKKKKEDCVEVKSPDSPIHFLRTQRNYNKPKNSVASLKIENPYANLKDEHMDMESSSNT